MTRNFETFENTIRKCGQGSDIITPTFSFINLTLTSSLSFVGVSYAHFTHLGEFLACKKKVPALMGDLA